MANSDIFGGNRETKTGQLLTAENASIDFGNGRVALVQGIQASYSQNVQPQFEVGANTLYFVNGQARGSLRVDSLVGQTGFLADLNMGKGACGGVDVISINLVDTNNCGWELNKRSALKFESAVPESVTITINAGQLQIVQSVSFVVGKLSVVD